MEGPDFELVSPLPRIFSTSFSVSFLLSYVFYLSSLSH